jgi:hypothetical protein
MTVSGWVTMGIVAAPLLGCGQSERKGGGEPQSVEVTDGGSVSLLDIEPSEGLPEGLYFASASFWRGPPAPCTIYPEHGCKQAVRCESWPEHSPQGQVSITAGSAAPLALPSNERGRLWQPGEAIVVEGEATADSPSFTASLVGPSYPVLSQPKPPLMFGAFVDIDRQQPLELVWNEDALGSVHLLVSAFDVTLGALVCTWPASDGRGTVPAELMATLEPTEEGNDDTYWQFTLLGGNRVVAESESFEIEVSATATGSNSSFPAFVR